MMGMGDDYHEKKGDNMVRLSDLQGAEAGEDTEDLINQVMKQYNIAPDQDAGQEPGEDDGEGIDEEVEYGDEEIDFDQLLGDAAQSQAEYDEDRDDQDFDDDDDNEPSKAEAKQQTLDSL